MEKNFTWMLESWLSREELLVCLELETRSDAEEIAGRMERRIPRVLSSLMELEGGADFIAQVGRYWLGCRMEDEEMKKGALEALEGAAEEVRAVFIRVTGYLRGDGWK